MVLLIGWKSASSSQKYSSDLGSDTSSVWNFCARFSDVISGVNDLWGRPEMKAVISGCRKGRHKNSNPLPGKSSDTISGQKRTSHPLLIFMILDYAH